MFKNKINVDKTYARRIYTSFTKRDWDDTYAGLKLKSPHRPYKKKK